MPIFPGPGGGGGTPATLDQVLLPNQSLTRFGAPTPIGNAEATDDFYVDAQLPFNGPLIGAIANGNSITAYVQWVIQVLPGQEVGPISVQFMAERVLEGSAETSVSTVTINVFWAQWDFGAGGTISPTAPDTGIFTVGDLATFAATFDASVVTPYSAIVIVLEATVTETSGADYAFMTIQSARVVAAGA